MDRGKFGAHVHLVTQAGPSWISVCPKSPAPAAGGAAPAPAQGPAAVAYSVP